MVIILDASVAIKWIVAEDDSDQAMSVLDDVLAKPDNFAVTELFYFELWNVLSIISKQQKVSAWENLKDVSEIGVHRFVFTEELYKASQKFIDLGLTAYDASYAGLAKILNGTWLTADTKAHNKIKSSKVSTLLKDYVTSK